MRLPDFALLLVGIETEDDETWLEVEFQRRTKRDPGDKRIRI
jgi:hypothetical protein